MAKIGYLHKSGFESSIEEKISFPNIWLVFGKISVEIFIISHFMKSHFSKVCWNQTFALNKIVNHWYVLKLQGRENSSSLKLNFSKLCSDLKSDKVGNCSPELEFSAPIHKTFGEFWRKKFILHCKKVFPYGLLYEFAGINFHLQTCFDEIFRQIVPNHV